MNITQFAVEKGRNAYTYMSNNKKAFLAIGVSLILFSAISNVENHTLGVTSGKQSIGVDADVQLLFTDTSSTSAANTLSLASNNPAVTVKSFGGEMVGIYDTSMAASIGGGNGFVTLDDNTSSQTESNLKEATASETGFPHWLKPELVAAEFQSNNTGEVPDITITAGASNALYFAKAGTDQADMLNITVEYGDTDGNNTLPNPGNALDATYKSFDLGSAYVPEAGYYWKPLPSSGSAGDITELLVKTGNSLVKSFLVKNAEPLYDHRQTPDATINGTNVSSRIKDAPSEQRRTEWTGVKDFDATLRGLAKTKLHDLDSDYDLVTYNLTGFSKFQVEDIGDVAAEETTTQASLFNLWGMIPQLTPSFSRSFETNILNGFSAIQGFGFPEMPTGGDISGGVQSISTTISDNLDDVTTTLDQGINDAADEVSDAGSGVADCVTSTFNDGMESAHDVAVTGGEEAQEAYEEATDTAMDAVSDAGATTVDMASDTVETVEDSVTNAGETVADAAADASQTTTSWAANAIGGVKEKIGGAYETVAHGVKGAVGSAVSFISGPLKWALIGVGAFIIILIIVVLYMKMSPQGQAASKLPGRV